MATNGLLGSDGVKTIDYQEVLINIVFKFIDVLQAAAVIAVGIFAIKFIRRYLQRIQVTHEAQRSAINLLEKLISGFLIVITITLALKIVGLDLTLIISALTLGLSFGLKDIIKNYVSGVLILFKSPFAIGDIVKIRSYVGKVEKIEFQSTTLKTFDRREVTIYNKDVLTQSIVNFSKELERRVEIRVMLGHGTDVAHAFKVFDALLEANPAILKTPKRTVVFKKFDGNGMELVLRFWVKRPCNILKIRTDLAMQIQTAFDEVKLLSPFARGVEFGEDIGMSEDRRMRLQLFYGQPALAAIAIKTNGAATATVGNGNGNAAPAAQNGEVEVIGPPAAVAVLNDEDEPEDF